MLALASAVFGFMSPFLPEVMKYFSKKQENLQQLKVLELQGKLGAQNATQELAKIDAQADVEEAATLRKPRPSYGVALLDAMGDKGWPLALLVPLVYAFGLLDLLAGLVRPLITYAVVAFYIVYKWARWDLLQHATGGTDLANAIPLLWDERDYAVLTLVLSFWFGQRVARYAFGWDQKR